MHEQEGYGCRERHPCFHCCAKFFASDTAAQPLRHLLGGGKKQPTFLTVVKVARALGCSAADLAAEAELLVSGGDCEIRTHGRLPVGSFQDCWFKPLTQVSAGRDSTLSMGLRSVPSIPAPHLPSDRSRPWLSLFAVGTPEGAAVN